MVVGASASDGGSEAAIGALAGVSAAASGGAASCGSVSGGSPGTLLASFVADQGSPAANMVTMSQGGKSNDTVTVRVNLTDTSSVYGVAFDVAYDETKVTYLGFTKGTALETSGNVPNYTVDGSTQPGRLVVGVSRAGGSATSVSGTKAVISFNFRVKITGTYPAAFENAVILDGQTTPQPLPGISWFGGAFEGV